MNADVMGCMCRAGNVERLHETIIRQTVEAAAILSPLPQSSISVVLQVGCMPVPLVPA